MTEATAPNSLLTFSQSLAKAVAAGMRVAGENLGQSLAQSLQRVLRK